MRRLIIVLGCLFLNAWSGISKDSLRTMHPHCQKIYSTYVDSSFRCEQSAYQKGIYNKHGQEIVPPIYNFILKKKKYGYKYRVMLDGMVWLIDKNGQKTRRWDTDVLRPNDPHKNIAPIEYAHGYYGAGDYRHKEALPFIYDKIKFYNGKFGVVRFKSKKYQIVDSLGVLVSTEQYDKVLDLHDSLLVVKKDGKYSLIHASGRKIFTSSNKIIPFAQSLYLEIKKDTPILWDANGQKHSYKIQKEDFSYPLLRLANLDSKSNVILRKEGDRQYRLFDIIKQKSSKFSYERIRYWQSKPTAFLRDSNWYFLDGDFKETLIQNFNSAKVRNKYDMVKQYADQSQYYFVGKSDKVGLNDFRDKTILPLEYDEIISVEDSIILAVKNGKMGIVDHKNQVLIPFKYDSLWTQGAHLGDCQDYYSSQFADRHFIVKQNGQFYAMDSRQKIIGDQKFAAFKPEGLFIPDSAGTNDSTWQISRRFSSGDHLPGAIFQKEGKWFVLFPDGTIKLRPQITYRILFWDGPWQPCWDWDK